MPTFTHPQLGECLLVFTTLDRALKAASDLWAIDPADPTRTQPIGTVRQLWAMFREYRNAGVQHVCVDYSIIAGPDGIAFPIAPVIAACEAGMD
jgi:hypothetical protein